MDYSQLYSWQFSPITIVLLVVAAVAAVALLVMMVPSLNLLIRKNEEITDTDLSSLSHGISVIIATGFHTDRLRACIEEIMAQEINKPVEIIIVNTGGEEYTEDAIRVLQSEFPEIKNTFVPINSRNLSKRKLAITLGIKAASHPVVLLTSANAIPQGSGWLSSVMNRFAEGADIVIGTSVISNTQTGESIGKIRAFDSVKSLLRRIPEAVKGKPIGADSANLAYRKSLFFSNKGFSETLNLIYGDDDIFISEIAKDQDVNVVLNSDSVLILHEDNPKQIYDLERKSRSFTQSKLRRAPFIVSGLQDIIWWVWLIASVAAIITSLPSLMAALVSILIAVSFIIPISIKWKKVTTLLSLPSHSALMPLLNLINPFITLRYKLNFGRKTRNYTWQNL